MPRPMPVSGPVLDPVSAITGPADVGVVTAVAGTATVTAAVATPETMTPEGSVSAVTVIVLVKLVVTLARVQV